MRLKSPTKYSRQPDSIFRCRYSLCILPKCVFIVFNSVQHWKEALLTSTVKFNVEQGSLIQRMLYKMEYKGKETMKMKINTLKQTISLSIYIYEILMHYNVLVKYALRRLTSGPIFT